MIGEQLTIDDYLARSPQFNGSNYSAEFDHARLPGQIRRIYDVMRDGRWRTLGEPAADAGDRDTMSHAAGLASYR